MIFTLTDGDASARLKVGYTPGAALPSTGGPGTALFYFFGTILTGLACVGQKMKHRRRART